MASVSAWKHRCFLALFIVLGGAAYYLTQHLIGGLTVLPCAITDRLQDWTAGVNAFLNAHPKGANALIFFYSTAGDLYLLVCFAYALWKKSSRLVLPLFLFLILRQIMQMLVTFPIAPGMIWHYPGFPSLFASYHISSDYYFSAYVGINLLVTLEFMKYKIRWLTTLGFFITFLEAYIDLVLRSHYTPDIYSSIIVALFVYLISKHLVERLDRMIHSRWVLSCCIGFGAAYYYAVQHFIGLKPLSTCGIVDQIQLLFIPITRLLEKHAWLGDATLILLNEVLDAALLFICVWTLYTRDVRPFLMILLFFTLRQSLQLLVSLPLPPHLIWHYPGFPSLFQTYTIGNDLYFSGHTGTMLILALELRRLGKKWLTFFGFALFGLEVILLWILEAHYTMDIFTAALTVLCLTPLSLQIAPPINRWFRSMAQRVSAK